MNEHVRQAHANPEVPKPHKWWKVDLPSIRRGTRDNIGLIVALFAALFTGWSGWEAHKARVSADNAAKQTIYLQQKAVDAQIDATRLDERPYVKVVPTDFRLIKSQGLTLSFTSRLNVLTSGRMPAMDLSIVWDCDEEIPGKGPQRVAKAVRDGTKAYSDNERTNIAYLTTSDEIVKTNYCPVFNISSGREGNPNVFIVGEVKYRDYFKGPHRTRFCFLGKYPELTDASKVRSAASIQNTLEFHECPNYPSVFE
jgi:hypothetical protein